MPSLLDIKARLKAVGNIRKITRAMQLVAAAKFKRSEERAKTARPYSEEVDGIVRALAGQSTYASDSKSGVSTIELPAGAGTRPVEVDITKIFEQPGEPAPKKAALVLVTSDRGLCGAFNTRLFRAAIEFVREHQGMDVSLVPIGRKGYLFFRNREIPILFYEERLNDKLDFEEIKRITEKLVGLYVTGQVDAVYLVYAQFKNVLSSTLRVDKFLSIPRVETDERQETFIFEPDLRSVYRELLPLYARTKIFAALADSFASEYGARMSAMQLATKNAEELIDALVIERNRLRQAAITKELAEIVGGAESLR